MLDVILQFIASTAGIALLIAVFKGLWSLFSERGPRKRVDAIKAAHETFLALADLPGAEAVGDQRDRELEGLRKRAERRELSRERWLRLTGPFRKRLVLASLLSAAAAAVSLGVALFLPDNLSTGSTVEEIDPWISLLTAFAAATAALTTSLLRVRAERRRRAEMLERLARAHRLRDITLRAETAAADQADGPTETARPGQ